MCASHPPQRLVHTLFHVRPGAGFLPGLSPHPRAVRALNQFPAARVPQHVLRSPCGIISAYIVFTPFWFDFSTLHSFLGPILVIFSIELFLLWSYNYNKPRGQKKLEREFYEEKKETKDND